VRPAIYEPAVLPLVSRPCSSRETHRARSTAPQISSSCGRHLRRVDETIFHPDAQFEHEQFGVHEVLFSILRP
jgi:hypothetical protein